MSWRVQNSDYRENILAADTGYKQTENAGKVFSQNIFENQACKTKETEVRSQKEELEDFKKEFYEELSKINQHGTVENMAINISEDAFMKMKEDPAYKDQILNLIKRDGGSSYAPRNCSLLITVGSSLKDYRADSWPVIADSEFDLRSQNSFYKKKSKKKKAQQKELLEEYLLKQQITKRMNQEIRAKKEENENSRQADLRKSDAEKAYENQIQYQQFLFSS